MPRFNKVPLVIYHGGGCTDGFGSAYAAWCRFGDFGAEYMPGYHGHQPPAVFDREVYLLDFSYSREITELLIQQARRVVVLDHHQTAINELETLLADGVIDGVLDTEHSGAWLAWRWFCPHAECPPLLEHIEDRDMKWLALPQTDSILEALRSYPMDFHVWRALMYSTERLRDEGCHILRFYRSRVAEVALRAMRGVIAGYLVPMANAPRFLAFDVAGALAPGEPFGAAYYDEGGHTHFSLRSCGPGAIDVSRLAERFGGGGHPDSAGFRVFASEPRPDASQTHCDSEPVSLTGFPEKPPKPPGLPPKRRA